MSGSIVYKSIKMRYDNRKDYTSKGVPEAEISRTPPLVEGGEGTGAGEKEKMARASRTAGGVAGSPDLPDLY